MLVFRMTEKTQVVRIGGLKGRQTQNLKVGIAMKFAPECFND